MCLKDQTTRFSLPFKFLRSFRWIYPIQLGEKISLFFHTLNLFHFPLYFHFLYYLHMQIHLLSVTTSLHPQTTLLIINHSPFYSLPSQFLQFQFPIYFDSTQSLSLHPLLFVFLLPLLFLSPLFLLSQFRALFPTPFPLFPLFPFLPLPRPLLPLSSKKSSSFPLHPTSFLSNLSLPLHYLFLSPSHRFHRLNSSEPGRNYLTTQLS